MSITSFLKKIFPDGVLVFVILEVLSWLVSFFIPLIAPYVGYFIIVLYVFYLFSFIKKDNVIPLQPFIQWLLFLMIPLFASLVTLSSILSFYSELSIIKVLKNPKHATFVSLVFFLFVLIIWTSVVAIKHMTNRKKYFAYASTCVPIKEISDESNITICLIKNKSHKESAWMFPGGHVDLYKNYYNEIDNSLSNILIIPENIVKKKAVEEAGLKSVKFVSLNNYREGKSQFETGFCLNAPAFNYLFKVNNSANCYSILKHRVHLDFTYVVSYSEALSKDAKYDIFEFTVKYNDLSQDSDEAISKIKDNLTTELNKHIEIGKEWKNKTSHELFPDSIPEMIYCSIKYYLAWKESQVNVQKQKTN